MVFFLCCVGAHPVGDPLRFVQRLIAHRVGSYMGVIGV
jgi:hypothetical protein